MYLYLSLSICIYIYIYLYIHTLNCHYMSDAARKASFHSESTAGSKIPFCRTPVGFSTFSMFGRDLHKQPRVGSPPAPRTNSETGWGAALTQMELIIASYSRNRRTVTTTTVTRKKIANIVYSSPSQRGRSEKGVRTKHIP